MRHPAIDGFSCLASTVLLIAFSTACTGDVQSRGGGDDGGDGGGGGVAAPDAGPVAADAIRDHLVPCEERLDEADCQSTLNYAGDPWCRWALVHSFPSGSATDDADASASTVCDLGV